MKRWHIGVVGAVAVLLTVAGVAAVTADRGSEADQQSAAATVSTERPTLPTTDGPTTTALPQTTTTTSVADVVAAGECPAIPDRALPDPDRPVYDVTVEADPVVGSATGTLRVTFTPDLPTNRLVFRLWPNGPRPAQAGASLEVGPVTSGRRTLQTEQPDPTTLVVAVGRELQPGESIEVDLPYSLTVPGSVKDRISHSGDSLRLGSFLPLLAWQPGVGWAEEPPTSGFAESTTSPTASWEVRINVPDGYTALASALPSDDGAYRIADARDFALSVGRFTLTSATIDVPDPVEVVVGVHAGVAEGGQGYLDRVTASIRDFSDRYGAYPWPSYTLAITPGMSGGIEFPGHVMQGPGSIGRTTPHEVAHMWFYGLAGNNQGQAPWLDEGLATFAEARFEQTLPSLARRDIPSDGRGRAGAPMTYWETHQGSYYRGVYVQTTAALAQLGSPELVDCALAHFVAEFAHQIVTPEQALAHLERFFPDARAVLAPYGLPAA